MRIARIATPAGPRSVIADGDVWLEVDDPYADAPTPTGERHAVEGASLLAPCVPGVVLGMAHNSGEGDRRIPPQAFMKSARTVVGPGAAIKVDPGHGRVVGEGELALVIGRTARDVRAVDAPAYVRGWTIGNDITCVGQADADDLKTQVKNGDGFTPLGPWIETDLDPLREPLVMRRNGEVVARSSTDRLARNPFECVEYLTRFMTLGPGDVVLTGAPWTTFDLAPGDTVECELPGIGMLRNPVVERAVPR
ncbi:fumarylacetoacetate hydrolase family protein [Mariniluteicoccus flavus]